MFSKLGKNDAALAGGKGASLGEMTQAGIPVPPGFVILADSFEKFLEETDLNVEVDSILHAVNHNEIHTVEDASEKIQALVLGADMPKDIAKEIEKNFKQLDAKYVAVRSSATAEDSSAAAWAGQLDSFLNTTEKELLTNVKRCWASLFTPRAIFYRFEKELHKTKISVAVVVQKMVASEISGIAFSVHPVTQDYNQLIIEAGFGLGEAIVSGQITPDSYVVEKEPRHIIDINVNVQDRALYRAEGGGNEWRNLSKDIGEKQVLSEDQILELAGIILNIEKNYGFPCDIEWAFEKGKFYIVQSRPITTLQVYTEINDALSSLVKLITREAPLSGVESWYEGIVQETRKFFGMSFPENFFIFRNGTVESWRDSRRLDNVPLELSEWVKKNTPKLVEGFDRQMETLSVINGIKKNIGQTSQEIITNLKKLRASFSSGFPGTVITYLMPLWQGIFSEKGTQLFDAAVIEQCAKWRNKADPFFDRSIDTTFHLLKALSRCTGLGFDLIKYARFNELEAFIETGEIDKEELKKRANSVIAYIDGKIIYEGDFVKELAERKLVLPEEKTAAVSEIMGSPAYRGLARGEVKIVYSRSELDKVNDGDILVAPMTTPWYLPALQRAASFITDEGGITCHAAIIARELKKPCVIGTKNATKILHDGDLVEVDADKGVVKILESNGEVSIKSEKQIYKKVQTRPLNLIDCECWDIGERLMMPKKYNDLLFFDPLFIYTPDKSVAVYYNFTDPKQGFQPLIDFLDANIPWFTKRKEQFVKDCKAARTTMKNNSNDYHEIMRLTGEMWASTAVANALGSTQAYKVSDKILKICLKIREEGDDVTHPITTYLNKIIAKKLKDIDTRYVTYTEFLENKLPSEGEIAKRSKGWLYHKGKVHLDIDKYIRDNNIEIVNPGVADVSDTLKGSVACKGNAKGKVKVIHKISELDKVEAGDVLVAPMTTPEMIPALKKAAAIITDEGGITCHAAIVSRELNIPCVIGTLSATEALKDGDLVEVDADNGVVKILKKNEKKDFKMYWTAQVSPLMASVLADCYTSFIPEKYGVGFEKAIIFSNGSKSTCYLRDEDRKKFGEFVIGKFARNANSVNLFCEETKKRADELMKFVSLPKKSLSKKTYEDFKKKFLEYNFYHITPRHLADFMAPEEIEKYKEQLTELRIYVEKLHYSLDSFLHDLLIKILRDEKINPNLYSFTEIEDAINSSKKLGAVKISEMIDFCLSLEGNKLEKIEKTEAAKLLDALNPVVDTSTITGTVAYHGRAKGSARIIFDPSSAKGFESGNILIAEMTRPEYVPFMNKAAAIITDGGGMLCHAAIIARELKKPCIIGTNNATKIIHDGDLVEVDADKGIVRIIR